GRRPEDVRLIAVTKTVPPEAIRHAAAAGVRDFAENYANELAGKAALIGGTWHFIGALQRGNAAKIAGHADVVHSARPCHAFDTVSRRAHEMGKTLPCLAQ